MRARIAQLEAEIDECRACILVAPERSSQRRIDEFRALMDILPIGVCIADDPACGHVRVNAEFARMLGISTEQNISHTPPAGVMPPFELLKDGEPIAGELLPMQTAVRELRPVHNVEMDAVFSDGRRVALVVNAAPLFDAQGQVRGAIATAWDVTERRERDAARRRLEQEHQAQTLESLSTLAGSIAHDFTNWLTVIRSYTSLLAGAVPLASSAGTHLQRIELAADDASEMCRRLLAYAGMSPQQLSEIDLTRLVRDLAGLLQPALSSRAELRLHLTGEPMTVAGDPAQLKQLVMNLLTNASEALGDEPGTIELCVSVTQADAQRLAEGVIRPAPPPGDYVQLEVRDSGCGMSPETVSRLFEPYFTTKFRGHGLGLPSIVGVIRSHRGTIFIDSAVGSGTTFSVLLPRTSTAHVG